MNALFGSIIEKHRKQKDLITGAAALFDLAYRETSNVSYLRMAALLRESISTEQDQQGSSKNTPQTT